MSAPELSSLKLTPNLTFTSFSEFKRRSSSPSSSQNLHYGQGHGSGIHIVQAKGPMRDYAGRGLRYGDGALVS